MSGYLEGLIAVLSINIIIAYSVYLPAAAGLLNLGSAGFVLVGAYTAGALTSLHGVPLWAAVPLGGMTAALVAQVQRAVASLTVYSILENLQ